MPQPVLKEEWPSIAAYYRALTRRRLQIAAVLLGAALVGGVCGWYAGYSAAVSALEAACVCFK